jgi:hypothetical protein
MKTKALIIILFAALASVVGVIYYTNVPASDLGLVIVHHKLKSSGTTTTLTELDGWQSYINKEFNFELKYPKDWKVASKLDIHGIKDVPSDQLGPGGPLALYSEYPYIQVSPPITQGQASIKIYPKGQVLDYHGGDELRPKNFNGVPALQLTQEISTEGNSPYEQRVIRFTILLKSWDQENYIVANFSNNKAIDDKIDQILSTFKFTK